MTSWFCDSFNCSSTQNLPVRLKKCQTKPPIPSSLKLTRCSSSKFLSSTQDFEKSFQSLNSQSGSLSIGKGNRRSFSTQLRKRSVEELDLFSSANQFDSFTNIAKPIKKSKLSSSLTDHKFRSLSEQIEPIEEEDLAVHHKKVEELRQWIRSKMGIERGGKTLLLTGPCGSAKTTAVKALCIELGVEVMEFDGNGQEYELSCNGKEVWDKSSLNIFFQFMRTSQLTSIEKMSLKHRLLLIEQIPSIFYQNINLLHDALREFVYSSRCLIVLVMSNIESYWELNPFRVFPAHILEELAIDHIKFNPISITNMTKAIKRIFTILKLKLSGSNTTVIKEIAATADGDIRKAMNLIEFFVFGKSAISSHTANLKNFSTSGHIELFHLIGKLMYAKRAESCDKRWLNSERKLLKKSRKKFGRPYPPKDDINELIDSCFVSGDYLSSYIFEHEPVFAPSLKALASVTSNLCSLDVLRGSVYDTSHVLDKYILEISARLPVFYNYRGDSNFKPAANHRGLYQFEKPKEKGIKQKCNELKRTAIDLFSSTFIRTTDMETLVLPMLSLMSFENKAQMNFINKFCFSNNNKGLTRIQSVKSQSISNSQSFTLSQSNLFNNIVEECDEFSYKIEEVI